MEMQVSMVTSEISAEEREKVNNGKSDELYQTLLRKKITNNQELSPAVRKAFQHVLRKHFLDPRIKNLAFIDLPLPIIGHQTNSQPYLVAKMLHMMNVKK